MNNEPIVSAIIVRMTIFLLCVNIKFLVDYLTLTKQGKTCGL